MRIRCQGRNEGKANVVPHWPRSLVSETSLGGFSQTERDKARWHKDGWWEEGSRKERTRLFLGMVGEKVHCRDVGEQSQRQTHLRVPRVVMTWSHMGR